MCIETKRSLCIAEDRRALHILFRIEMNNANVVPLIFADEFQMFLNAGMIEQRYVLFGLIEAVSHETNI